MQNKKGARHKQAHKEIKQRQRAEKAQNGREAAAARHLKVEKRRKSILGWLRDKHKLVTENVEHRYLIDELREELSCAKDENAELAEQLKEVTDKLNRRTRKYELLYAEAAAMRAILKSQSRDLTRADVTDDMLDELGVSV